MDPRESARLGKAALDVGARDRGTGSERDDAIDTVANILHHLESRGEEDPAAILASAAALYFAERREGR
jgi:hypothetical protein